MPAIFVQLRAKNGFYVLEWVEQCPSQIHAYRGLLNVIFLGNRVSADTIEDLEIN